MDLPSRLLTLVEDLVELPRFLEVKRALDEAARDGMKTMGRVCREQAERIPDRVALRFEREVVTYGEFNAGVNRFAHLLRRAGVGRGDVVNVMMENSPSMLMAQGACAKLGAIGALVNTHLEGEALAHVHRVSGAKVAVVDRPGARALLPMLDSLRDIEFLADVPEKVADGTRFRPLAEALDAASDAEPDMPDVGPGDVFLYVYTSGTTGFPKPAIVRHAKFTAGGRSLSVLLGETEDDCAYAPTPLYHGYANFVGFSPAFHRGACFASRRRFSASEFLADARRHGVTIFCYVGELCRYLMRTPPSPADRDHRIRLATGPGLRPDVWEAFRDRFGIPTIIDSYGQTEGNVSLQNRRGRVGSCGRCAPFQHDGLRLARRDPQSGELVRGHDGFLVECAVGEAGELLSRISKDAPMAFDGYANPADNESKLLRDAFAKGDRWLRTGDLLRRDRASYYYFVDRIGDTFRWKGENVATMEVEHLLNRAPGVHETAVYGVRVPGTDGRAGMALVVPGEGTTFDPESFHAHVSRSLPGYARPLFVRVAAAVDVTGNFKNRKSRLQDEGFDPSRTDDALWFRDDDAGRYVPLDAALHAAIASGEKRL